MKDRVCEICGKTFLPTGPRQKFCDIHTTTEKNKWMTMRRAGTVLPYGEDGEQHETVASVARAANEAGLSYGYKVALDRAQETTDQPVVTTGKARWEYMTREEIMQVITERKDALDYLNAPAVIVCRYQTFEGPEQLRAAVLEKFQMISADTQWLLEEVPQ